MAERVEFTYAKFKEREAKEAPETIKTAAPALKAKAPPNYPASPNYPAPEAKPVVGAFRPRHRKNPYKNQGKTLNFDEK